MKNTTLTFTENEVLYLLVISGAESEDLFRRFHLQMKDTTKERLEAGKESLLSRELITFEGDSNIPVMKDEVIGLIGAIAVGTQEEDGYYHEPQTEWKAQLQKEGEWYVISGQEVEASS